MLTFDCYEIVFQAILLLFSTLYRFFQKEKIVFVYEPDDQDLRWTQLFQPYYFYFAASEPTLLWSKSLLNYLILINLIGHLEWIVEMHFLGWYTGFYCFLKDKRWCFKWEKGDIEEIGGLRLIPVENFKDSNN